LLAEFADAGLWPGLPRRAAEALRGSTLRSPDDVTGAALTALPGVGGAQASRLAKALADSAEVWDVAALLHAAGLPLRPAARLAKEVGPGAGEALRTDPWRYLLLPDNRLEHADRLAASLGLGREHPARGPAVAAHLLALSARQGHTARPHDGVAAQAAARGVRDPGTAIAAALTRGTVIADGTNLALARSAHAEESLAEHLGRLVRTAEPWSGTRAARVSRALDRTQRAAVRSALGHGVSLLTGGPGTGKSRTVAALVAVAEAGGHTVALAAPTGRAAKRLEELSDAPASTLHRLLGAVGTTGEFSRGESWPLDADLVVVDEASMLDAELAAALLSACADGTHLLLVGDPAQLPSIGAGRVLGDLLDGGRLPTTELTTLYRQDAGGTIARLATAVRAGELPAVDDPTHEVVVVPAGSSAEVAHRVVQLVTDSIPRVLSIPAADVQVVTPVHRGDAGTHALNAALKARLNPGPGAHRGFDPGDRVVALANRLEAGFTNGEVGTVLGAGDGGGLRVAFTTGPADVPGDAVAELTLGFAITVHRAQGSEWPAVVVAVPGESAGMLSRPLIYTALTRARRHLSVVPSVGPTLNRAVAAVGAAPRVTRLQSLLARELPEPAISAP
jgi:exodeoxyribonuclease V alpha subunit